MDKIKKIFTNLRIIILLVVILLAVVAIYPNPYAKGAAIRALAPNSSAMQAGIESPQPTQTPMSRERILSIKYACQHSRGFLQIYF